MLTVRRKSPICVVLERDGRPEHGEEAVAEVADQGAPVVEDRLDHLAEVVVEKVDDAVGRRPLGECGELPDVGEHYGADAATAAEAKILVRPLQYSIDDVLGHKPGEHLAYPLAFDLSKALLGQRGVDPSPQEDRIEWLGEVVLGPHLDAGDDGMDLRARQGK